MLSGFKQHTTCILLMNLQLEKGLGGVVGSDSFPVSSVGAETPAGAAARPWGLSVWPKALRVRGVGRQEEALLLFMT